jgi:quinol---cytochrome c reductase cytochrome c subunit, bacillus type
MTPPNGTSTDIPVVKAGASWLIGRFVLASEGSRKPITGGPTTIPVSPPQSVVRGAGLKLTGFYFGRSVTAQMGCLACHRIGEAGNNGPGPDLTHVGSTLSPKRIERAIIHARAPMPSFSRLPRAQLRALVTFLSLLR